MQNRWQMYAGMLVVQYAILRIAIALNTWRNVNPLSFAYTINLYNLLLLFPICSECGYLNLTCTEPECCNHMEYICSKGSYRVYNITSTTLKSSITPRWDAPYLFFVPSVEMLPPSKACKQFNYACTTMLSTSCDGDQPPEQGQSDGIGLNWDRREERTCTTCRALLQTSYVLQVPSNNLYSHSPSHLQRWMGPQRDTPWGWIRAYQYTVNRRPSTPALTPILSQFWIYLGCLRSIGIV